MHLFKHINSKFRYMGKISFITTKLYPNNNKTNCNQLKTFIIQGELSPISQKQYILFLRIELSSP